MRLPVYNDSAKKLVELSLPCIALATIPITRKDMSLGPNL